MHYYGSIPVGSYYQLVAIISVSTQLIRECEHFHDHQKSAYTIAILCSTSRNGVVALVSKYGYLYIGFELLKALSVCC